jgi:hypothetical protein
MVLKLDGRFSVNCLQFMLSFKDCRINGTLTDHHHVHHTPPRRASLTIHAAHGHARHTHAVNADSVHAHVMDVTLRSKRAKLIEFS